MNETTARSAPPREREEFGVEAAMAEIARDFVERAVDDFEGCVADALARLGTALRAARVWLRHGTNDDVGFSDWAAPGLTPLPQIVASLGARDFRWLLARLAAGEPVLARAIEDFPVEAADERTAMAAFGTAAVICVPMLEHGELVGFVGMDGVSGCDWDDATVVTIRQFAAMVTAAGQVMAAQRARRASENELREREQRFRALLASSNDIIVVIGADQRVMFASEPIERVLGWNPNAVVGRDMLDFVHVDDRRDAIDAFLEAIDDEKSNRHVEVRLQRADGGYETVEVVGNNHLANPVIQGIVVNVRDVSERKQFEAEMRDAQTAFERVFDEAPIGMCSVGLDRRFMRVNHALCELLGYDMSELSRLTVGDITHPDDRDESQRLIARLLDGQCRSYTTEKRYVRKDGVPVWVRIHVSAVRSSTGQPLYTVGHVEDITERRAYEDRLTHEATHDTLTGLALRSLLLLRLDDALARARVDDTYVAVLFVDLDKFKRINDSFGHAAGDALLIDAARRLRAAGRGSDTIGRFGGDEFVFVCPGLNDPNDAYAIADRIRREFDEPFVVADLEVLVGASVGIATSSGNVSAETILHHADTAAYRAKERGRNRIELWDDELRERVEQRLRIETALRHALEQRNELVLHYQPIVRADTGRIDAFEALVRWQHPERGLLGPGEFLPVAEETGLIVPLGLEVLEKACAQLGAWHDTRGDGSRPTVSVNISARQLAQPDLVDEVHTILWSTRVAPDAVCLEITETLLMHDTEQTVQTLDALRALGVRLAIDDFGTGYSSLSYLRRLPVSVVKIDRSFVTELGRDREVSTIVASVIDLAHALGMTIVAEGVETSEQVEALVALGCDAMQGFHLSRPVPAADAERLLHRGWQAAIRPAS